MRKHAFDNEHLSLIDHVIWFWREIQIKQHLPKQTTVAADLGCGQRAKLLRRLIQRRLITQGVGFDVSPNTTVQYETIKIIEADLNNSLPITNSDFDVVFSLAVIEHLTNPERHVAEAYRILKPGGVFLLTTPSPRAKPVLEFLAFRLGVIDRFEIADHKHYFSKPELRALLVKSGFRLEDIKVSLFQFGFNTFVVARK